MDEVQDDMSNVDVCLVVGGRCCCWRSDGLRFRGFAVWCQAMRMDSFHPGSHGCRLSYLRVLEAIYNDGFDGYDEMVAMKILAQTMRMQVLKLADDEDNDSD